MESFRSTSSKSSGSRRSRAGLGMDRDGDESSSQKNNSKGLEAQDAYYGVDEAKLNILREQKPFLRDPKYFKSVKVSPSATMKMMMHVQAGVEKGIKKSITGKPTEVMGLLVGRQDTQDPNCLIISDAQALAVEGFETSVVAQSDEALTYQINLANLNERSRHASEKFCGWYHSHPFDQEEYSHCYLSNTDVTTQLMWQRSTEKDGDPWLAIVIDPLRSIAKGYPNMESFRVYPPEYTSVPNETPDGRIITDDKTRLQLWGNCWNRYYKLDTSFYMSSLASNVLGVLKNNFLWQNSFTRTPMLEADVAKATADRMMKVATDLQAAADGRHGGGGSFGGQGGVSGGSSSSSSSSSGSSGSSGSSSSSSSSSSSGGGGSGGDSGDSGKAPGGRAERLKVVSGAACSIAADHCASCCSQMAKLALFNPNDAMKRAAYLKKRRAAAEATSAGAEQVAA